MSNDLEKKKLFIFDAGNVSITNIQFMDKISSYTGICMQELENDYLKYEFPFYDGYVSEEEYLRHLEVKYKVRFEENLVRTGFHPVLNMPVISLVDRLREKGYRVVLGSNTIALHVQVMWEIGMMQHYQAHYLSNEIHLSKPDREFFDYILEKEGVKGEDAFFMDDRADYLEGAVKAGITTFHYAGDDKDERLEKTFSFLED